MKWKDLRRWVLKHWIDPTKKSSKGVEGSRGEEF
jgi:hypothetical protein